MLQIPANQNVMLENHIIIIIIIMFFHQCHLPVSGDIESRCNFIPQTAAGETTDCD